MSTPEPSGTFRDFRSLRLIRVLLDRAPLLVRVSFLVSVGLVVIGLPIALVNLATTLFAKPNVVTLFAIFFALAVTFALWFYSTAGSLLGRGWARNLLTVLGLIVTADAVASVVLAGYDSDSYGSAFDYLNLLVGDATVVLLWFPTSREFFRQAKVARKAVLASRQPPLKLGPPNLG